MFTFALARIMFTLIFDYVYLVLAHFDRVVSSAACTLARVFTSAFTRTRSRACRTGRWCKCLRAHRATSRWEFGWVRVRACLFGLALVKKRAEFAFSTSGRRVGCLPLCNKKAASSAL